MDKQGYIANEEHLHKILKELHTDHERRLPAIVDCAVRQAIAELAPAFQVRRPSEISASSASIDIHGHRLDDSSQPMFPSSMPPSLATVSSGFTMNDTATEIGSKYEMCREMSGEEKRKRMRRDGTSKLSYEDNVKSVNKRLNRVTQLAREDTLHLEEGGFRHTVAKIVTSPQLDYAVALLIFANAVLIAAQTELAAQRLEDKPPPEFRALDLIFTIFFTIELSLRIFVEQRSFITGINKGWNCFDSLVVASALLEEVLKTSNSTTTIRVLRIMRLVRVVRVIRTLRIFKDLRAMVKGVINSLLSLVWAVALLGVICFITSIFITQVVTTHRIQNREASNKDTELEINFGSLAATMYSLYKAITGGDDWSRFADPLFDLSNVMGLFFCLYVSFGVFAVLNVVTGVFVDNAIKVNQQDADYIIMEQNDQRQKHIDEMKSVFKKADADGSGMLNLSEFQQHLEDPCVQAYFRQLELDVEGPGAQMVFSLLDFDGDGTIDAEEFIFGCGQLRGFARSVDVARLNHGQRRLFDRLMSFVAEQKDRLDSFQHILSSMLIHLAAIQQNQRKLDQNSHKLPAGLEDARKALDHHQQVCLTDPVLELPGTIGDRAVDASSLRSGVPGFQDANGAPFVNEAFNDMEVTSLEGKTHP